MGKQTAGNALVFRDLLDVEGIRSKVLTVCSGAWGTSTWTVYMYMYLQVSAATDSILSNDLTCSVICNVDY